MEISVGPAPVYVGLRTKVRCPKPDAWNNNSRADPIVEICSVSNCITGGPIIWRYGFGEAFHWTREENIAYWTAIDAARQEELIKYEVLSPQECYTEDQLCLCAYRIFPLLFTRAAEPTVLEPRQFFGSEYELPLPEPDWTQFERLGYDVVQFKPIHLLDFDDVGRAECSLTSGSHGCSPLSCNMQFDSYPVNRYCLMDELDRAYQLGLQFGREEPEPGPYVIVEVWRRREQRGAPGRLGGLMSKSVGDGVTRMA